MFRSIIRSRAGFTAIEIMTVLVVMGLATGMAAPSITGMVSNGQRSAALETVASDISYARMLAVRNGMPATLTFNATGYVIQVDGRPAPEKTVNLKQEYPSVTRAGSTSLRFNSRGLLQGGSSATIKATAAARTDSIFVSTLGAVHRGY